MVAGHERGNRSERPLHHSTISEPPLRHHNSRSATQAEGTAYLIACLPPLFWAGNFLLARMFRDAIPPFQMSFWRWTIALIIIGAMAAPGFRANLRQIRKELPFLVFLGAVGITAFNVFVYSAMDYTTVINAALVNSLLPVVTFVLALLLMNDRLTAYQTGGVILSVIGVFAIVTRGDLSALAALEANRGDILVFIGMSFWALYTVMIKWRPTKLPPLVFLAVTVSFGVLFHLPLIGWELAHVGAFPPTLSNIGALLSVAIFSSVLAYICWGRAVAALGPGRTGMFVHLLPVFSAILAVIFLDERLYGYHLVGVIFIFSGIVLVTRPGRLRTA